MPKIKVKSPIVDISGDEMANVIWEKIKTQLITPFIDIKLLSFDLGIKNRDLTNDEVTTESARAIKKHKTGVKCATITPDDKRVKEYKLKRKYPSPNGTIRNILNGTIFREPIIIKNIPKFVNHWDEPVVLARHAFGDIYKSKEIDIKKKGKLSLRFESFDKKEIINEDIFDFTSSGVGLSYFNVDNSIEDFAISCFNFSLKRKLPLFLSTKNTILQKYDERFKNIFDNLFEKKFKKKFDEYGLTYQHRLIDDMVACLMKWSGGFLWACKNYDGDVMSDLIAQGYGSLGLMTSILQSPDGNILETEAAHGTVTSHFLQHQKGIKTSTNPIASIFAWTRGLLHISNLDKNSELKTFAENLESICISTVEKGIMTKDLALMVGPDQKWINTDEMFKTLRKKLESK
jgi:isocitrate dehydrogenase|tara:strand:- start:3842 stop:5050 length:1209 start_codon:yes stop_codon:yes gene_type:complete